MLETELNSHVKHLATSIDMYAAGDYAMAYELMGMGYTHMWATGDVLSEPDVGWHTTVVVTPRAAAASRSPNVQIDG